MINLILFYNLRIFELKFILVEIFRFKIINLISDGFYFFEIRFFMQLKKLYLKLKGGVYYGKFSK